MPVEAPGAGVGVLGMRVLVPGAWAMPGGQWVVPLGGCEMGGLFIGSLGVGGGVAGLLGELGLLGAALAESAAAPSNKAERVTDRYFMMSSLMGIPHASGSAASLPCVGPHFPA